MTEEWKNVPDYEHVEVSNCGNVRTIDRMIINKLGHEYLIKGKPLKSKPNPAGYLRVSLNKDGHGKREYVHRLVAQLFIGDCPENYQVNHKDGNKLNNHVDNLEYVTMSQNIKHAFQTGLTQNKGEDHYKSSLTAEQVLEIRQLYKSGEYSQRELAKVFGVSRGCIKDIVNRKNWRHI